MPGLSINDLPLDILLALFQTSVNAADATVAQAVLLSSVCAHWRAVALSDPTIWTVVRAQDEPNSVSLTEMLLVRSQSAPLDITVTRLSSAPELAPFEAMLMPHMHRCSQMKMRMETEPNGMTSLPLLIEFVISHTTELTTLELIAGRRGSSAPAGVVMLDRLASQPIRDMKFRSITLRWDTSLRPFSHLRSLILDFPHPMSSEQLPSLTDVIHFLRSAPRLKLLELRFWYPPVASEPTGLPAANAILLPELENLLFGGCNVVQVTRLMNRIDLPHLTSLSLHNNYLLRGDVLDESIVWRLPALQEIQVFCTGLFRCHRILPVLRQLSGKLDTLYLPPNIVDEIFDELDDIPSCSHLKELDMICSPMISAGALKNWLAARDPDGRRVNIVRYAYMPNLEEDRSWVEFVDEVSFTHYS